ncbi:MAG: Uncharacterised protein [Prochlorococcus marinus str. MIT 9215]|nr:MAG: Uncharacterised protein [Prochlorococcus marinus str. MIT 9215]
MTSGLHVQQSHQRDLEVCGLCLLHHLGQREQSVQWLHQALVLRSEEQPVQDEVPGR